MPFVDLAAAQAAVAGWVAEYNTRRPHQALKMAVLADRFAARSIQERQVLPLRLPAVVRLAVVPPQAGPVDEPEPVIEPEAGPGPVVLDGGPVEFDRVVPTSGNLAVAGRQFWLGPAMAGVKVTFWADSQTIHLLNTGERIKTLRSHLSTADLAVLAARGGRKAGPAPLPPVEQKTSADEVERTVNRDGLMGLADKSVLAAEILSGRRVAIRIEGRTLAFFDPASRELLRARPNPLTAEQTQNLRGARPAGPPPHRHTAPVVVQRRPSATGVIVVAGQKVSLGREQAGQVVTVHIAAHRPRKAAPRNLDHPSSMYRDQNAKHHVGLDRINPVDATRSVHQPWDP